MQAPSRLLSEGEDAELLALQGGPVMETWMRRFYGRFIITRKMRKFLRQSSKLLCKRRYQMRHMEGLKTYFDRLEADLKRFTKLARKSEDVEDVAKLWKLDAWIRGNMSTLRHSMTSRFIYSLTGLEMAVYWHTRARLIASLHICNAVEFYEESEARIAARRRNDASRHASMLRQFEAKGDMARVRDYMSNVQWAVGRLEHELGIRANFGDEVKLKWYPWCFS